MEKHTNVIWPEIAIRAILLRTIGSHETLEAAKLQDGVTGVTEDYPTFLLVW